MGRLPCSYLGGLHIITRVLVKGCRRVRITEGDMTIEAEIRVIPLLEGATIQGMQAAFKSGKARREFSPSAYRRNTAIQTM